MDRKPTLFLYPLTAFVVGIIMLSITGPIVWRDGSNTVSSVLFWLSALVVLVSPLVALYDLFRWVKFKKAGQSQNLSRSSKASMVIVMVVVVLFVLEALFHWTSAAVGFFSPYQY